jgi:hypothetical protein
VINLGTFSKTIVKVTVENQPSIRNLEFKDFLKFKQTKSPEYNLLGTGKKDIYLLAKSS